MNDLSCGEDPEPAEPVPAGPLHVPVRPGPSGCAVRMFRTPLGARTAVAFTSRDRLVATLGRDQEWIRLSASALRALAAPLGVTTVVVDPAFTAPAPRRGAFGVQVRRERSTGASDVVGAPVPPYQEVRLS